MTDIIRKRGDTFPEVYVVKRETTGEVLPITGYSFKLTVDPAKKPLDDTNNLFQIAGNITDAANGVVEFGPTTGQADNIGTYYYDIEMTDGAGKIRTIDAGKFKLTQDITK